MLTINDIRDDAVQSLMNNSQKYTNYRKIGRDISRVTTNILLLYLVLKQIPYMETTDNNDINRAQGLIMQTI